MSRFALRGKFIITLSLGSIALFIMFLFSLESISTINDTFYRLQNIDSTGKIIALEVSNNINLYSRFTRNIMLGSDIELDIKSMMDISHKTEEYFNQLSALPFNPEENELIAKAHVSASAFIKEGYDIISNLKSIPAGERHAGYKVYDKSATPLAMAFREHFGNFEKAMNVRYDVAVADMQDKIYKRKIIMWIVLIASISCLYGVGFAFTNQDLNVMRDCIAFAEELGTQNLTRRLDTQKCASMRQLVAVLNNTAGNFAKYRTEVQMATTAAQKERDDARRFLAEAQAAKEQAEGAKAEGMLDAAKRLKDVVVIVTSASEQLSTQIEQSSRGSEEQVRRVDETATAMAEMNATVLEVAKNASLAAHTAELAKSKAEDGSQIVRKVVEGIENVLHQAQEMKDDMGNLGLQAQGIGNIMNVISDIADQTNLLALNAAIEAARAGDAGRGFAVVADEVRKLAEKTMTATKEVGDAIQGIQDSAKKNIANVERSGKTIEHTTNLAVKSGEALLAIVTLVESASDQVRSIATASEQQSATSEEINRSIEDVSRISSETSDAMGRSSSAVSALANQAHVLSHLIEEMHSEEGCYQQRPNA
jgi:methyl-accepting chemotaxis protein